MLTHDRRTFITGTLAAVAFASVARAVPAGAVPADSAAAGSVPPNFPAGIALFRQKYQNWSKEIVVDGVWTCSPRHADDVVTLADWAVEHGYRLRPRGAMHGWTPFTIEVGEDLSRVVLVDTMTGMTEVSVDVERSTVTAGAGATLHAILSALETHGLAWSSVPAPGVLSIAGALAVGAHGAALRATGEVGAPGSTLGSLSNLVTSMRVVAKGSNGFELRTVARGDDDAPALATHLGRAFVTEVTLQAHELVPMRCRSFTDIGWSEMFATAGSSGRTMESFLDSAGRAEAIWYPFTDTPWLKVWSLAPMRPQGSRQVTEPYNYPFSDTLPEAVSDVIGAVVSGRTDLTPGLGRMFLAATVAGLAATASSDIWGNPKNVQFYIRPSTLLLTEGGGAVLTSRANAATVVHDFTQWFRARVDHYAALGRYPINGPVEIRCCGLDQEDDVLVESAGAPTLSAMRPRPDRPEWDTAIWLNVLGIPGTPGMFAFYREMEQWMRQRFDGVDSVFRPEWSKGWAFSEDRPYEDAEALGSAIPQSYRDGYEGDRTWDTVVDVVDRLDPDRVFSNAFLDRFVR
ncbi:cholesterol oxidase substrate-binding domain-containing protein [Rhodococcus sp. MEB064]|uniref:cholesterol oxidase substrate-binding domain-containing protein n=1 Tax=Rhodococcus sp. MEB064 TaxID=1587522 RepID=UPI0005AC9499|nr:cholesterol oxidase substrate-binding domain-containing protein [Rhodococcus sp. MEB064]KIQ19274.1 FAD-linked oxidase [Rhodococcus sp. MEB064]